MSCSSFWRFNLHPGRDEISVTFFGPGFGESIVVHVGDRNWIIIDSCLNDAKEPAALAYLREIGVDLLTEVKLILATHWHDDHIKGLSDTLDACSGADFAIPLPMTHRDFLAYLMVNDNQRGLEVGRGGTEIIKCLRGAVSRKSKYVVSDRSVKVWDEGALSHGQRVELMALSPSDGRVKDFMVEIGRFLDDVPERPSAASPPKGRIATKNKNDLSVATVLTVGSFALLFGADVEEDGNSEYGWSNIVDARRGRSPKPHIFKVAHHGSEGSHHAGVWADVLRAEPISVVTPWLLGGNSLPSEVDKRRISSLSKVSYITSSELVSLKKRYARDKLRLIERSGVKVSSCIFRCGSVTLNVDAKSGDIGSVSLSGSAGII